jgi:hypothetical protein
LGFGGEARDWIMKARTCLGSLLASALGVFALTAGEQPPPAQADARTEANQAREEEIEAPLSTLEVRCKKMIEMQIAVYDGTKGLQKIIEGHTDKKPSPEDNEIAIKLSEKQKAIIAEATKATDILKAEGTAVAFAEVFELLRDDMKCVQKCLGMSDVGTATQAVEQDIINTLKEMITPFR